MDPRAIFFVGAAVACVSISPVAPPDFRWVAYGLSALYVVLALASWLDARGRR